MTIRLLSNVRTLTGVATSSLPPPATHSAKGDIVVVDDEANIADLVEMYLRKEGYRVYKADCGEDALRNVTQHRPQLVILDVGLPDLDGFEVCRRLRADGVAAVASVPVIFLTARDDEIDRVLGLELGADDYVTKPFSPRELVARVKAILRRAEVSATNAAATPAVFSFGRVVIDLGRREVTLDSRAVEMTTREFDLLTFMCENAGLALSRQQLLDGVWGPGWYGDPRTVDVHMAQVRKKIDDAITIKTVRGVGYRLDRPAS